MSGGRMQNCGVPCQRWPQLGGERAQHVQAQVLTCNCHSGVGEAAPAPSPSASASGRGTRDGSASQQRKPRRTDAEPTSSTTAAIAVTGAPSAPTVTASPPAPTPAKAAVAATGGGGDSQQQLLWAPDADASPSYDPWSDPRVLEELEARGKHCISAWALAPVVKAACAGFHGRGACDALQLHSRTCNSCPDCPL